MRTASPPPVHRDWMPSTAVAAAILGGLSLRVIVAFWNGYFGPSYGAELDALTFHLEAAAQSKNAATFELQVGWYYVYVLGIFYTLTTDSLFLGSLMSCLAWALSAALIARAMALMSIESRQQTYAMVVFAFLPSSVLLTSVTLREVYQLLFVNIAFHAAVCLYFNRSPLHWLAIAVSIALMGALHGALIGYGFFFLAASICTISLRAYFRSAISRGTIAVILVVGVLVAATELVNRTAYDLSDGVATAVAKYQFDSLNVDARTHYKAEEDIGEGMSLILGRPLALLQYWFEPMPWRISAAADLELMLENLLRAWLIWRAMFALRRTSNPAHGAVVLTFISYLALELIWSLGSVNWGSAARHHIPSVGLLVVAAAACARVRWIRRAAPGSFSRSGAR